MDNCNELYPDHLIVSDTLLYAFMAYVGVCFLMYGMGWVSDEIEYRKIKREWRDTPKNRKRKGYE